VGTGGKKKKKNLEEKKGRGFSWYKGRSTSSHRERETDKKPSIHALNGLLLEKDKRMAGNVFARLLGEIISKKGKRGEET